MKEFIAKLIAPVVESVLRNLYWTDVFQDVGYDLADGAVKRFREELDYKLSDTLESEEAYKALSAVIKKNLPKTKPATKAKIKKGF